MPPELIINSTTGFLDRSTDNSFSVFSSDKKTKFIEMASEISRIQGIIPNINDLCKVIGVDQSNFYKHLNMDSAFKNAWQQCLLNVEAHLQSKMTEFAQRPGNYMDRITALRRIAPERWNPEYKVTTEVSHTYLGGLVDKAGALEAEVCPVNDPKLVEPPSE